MDVISNEPISNDVVKLSERQRQCLQLVKTGLTSKEIGRLLEISPSTVDNHIQTACDRLGAKNRTDAARLYESGRTEPDNEQYLTSTTLRDAEAANIDSSTGHLFQLPPLGGKQNNLPKGQRIFHIIQIAVLSIIVVAAAILTIAGLVHILSGAN